MRSNGLTICDAMSSCLEVIESGGSLQTAMEKMLDANVSALPVMNNQSEAVGIVTRTDIMHAYNMKLALETPVDVVMTENLQLVIADDSLEKASEIMLSANVGRLVVIDGNAKPAAMVTRSDVMRAMTQTLSNANGQLQAIVSSIPDGLLVADKDGIIFFCNAQFYKISNLLPDGVIGRKLNDVLPQAGKIRFDREPIRGMQCKVGNASVLLTMAYVEPARDKQGVIVILHDITEFQKMADEITNLNQINENLHAIFSSINEGIHAVNKDGVTIFYNEMAAALDGMNVEEVLNKPLLDCFPSLTAETSTLISVVRTGRPYINQQQTYKNAKGQNISTINSTIPLMSHGQLIGALEVSQDITKVRKLSEKIVDLQAELYKNEMISRKPTEKKQKSCNGAYYTFDDIIGNCEAMLKSKFIAYRAAQSSSPILVEGETGTGKELFVHAIHNASRRKEAPFIAQNCAALPETLLEGILFGTVRGGFTGAEDRPGLFELANGGTLFLDEINSMDISLQAKLLRALQEGVVRRVADTKVRPIDVRIVAATNVDPRKAVEEGRLRADLFYRLNVVNLRILPLRDRLDDIPILVKHFIQKYNEALGMEVEDIAPVVLDIFMHYAWPGNVRELEHVIEGCMNILDGRRILPEHLPDVLVADLSINSSSSSNVVISGKMGIRPLREAMAEAEDALIRQAMTEAAGNVSRAARLLDLPRQTLQYKLRILEIAGF